MPEGRHEWGLLPGSGLRYQPVSILQYPAAHTSTATGMAIVFACFLMPGCAHNTYSVRSLPHQYVAPSVADYSSLDLTAYAGPAPDEHEIRAGDRLEIAMNSGIAGADAVQKWRVGVDDDGNATLPHVGRIRLAGLTRAQAEQTIGNESIRRDIYLTPAVNLNIEERQRNSIVATGGVRVPGKLEFPQSSLSLADVIVRAGGLTTLATGNITVNRAESTWDQEDRLTTVSRTVAAGESVSLNLATTSAAELAGIQVPSGATVAIEERPVRSVRVIGVIRDGAIEIPPGRNMRLLDALALAGGPTYSHWISNRVDIIRRLPDQNETIRIKASIRRAKAHDEANLRLAPNDIVSVEENMASFSLSTLGGLSGLTGVARTAMVP